MNTQNAASILHNWAKPKEIEEIVVNNLLVGIEMMLAVKTTIGKSRIPLKLGYEFIGKFVIWEYTRSMSNAYSNPKNLFDDNLMQI